MPVRELIHRSYLLRTVGVDLAAAVAIGAILAGIATFVWDELHRRWCREISCG